VLDLTRHRLPDCQRNLSGAAGLESARLWRLAATMVTISATNSRSLILRFCEARRSMLKAVAASQHCWAMVIPMARSMTAREVNACCRSSDSFA
jgi:hypothetical protein